MTASNDFDGVLQICLDQLVDGQQSIDDVLAKFPDQSLELRPLLESALWFRSQRSELVFPQARLLNTRQTLMRQIKKESRSETLENRKSKTGINWSWRSLQPFLLRFSVGLLICALLAGFGGGVALASQNTIPGDTIYPVKTSIEQIHLLLTPSPEDKQALLLQFSETRLQEAEQCALKQRYQGIEIAMQSYEEHVQQVLVIIEAMKKIAPEKAYQMAMGLNVRLQFMSSMLVQIDAALPPGQAKLFERGFAVSQNGMDQAIGIMQETGKPLAQATVTATKTPGESGGNGNIPNKDLTPTALPPGQVKKLTPSETQPVFQSTEIPTEIVIEPTKTPKPENTHKPTSKPEEPKPTQKPDEPKPTKEPKPSKTPKK